MSATDPVYFSVSTAGRFANAWDAFQFAAAHLAYCRKLYALAEIAGNEYLVSQYKQAISAAEHLANAAEREWRKTGPSA